MKKFNSLNSLLCNATFVLFNGDMLRVSTYIQEDGLLYLEDEDTGSEYSINVDELEFPRDKVFVLEEGTHL